MRRCSSWNLAKDAEPRLVEPDILGNLTPADTPESLPTVATLPEETSFLHQQALTPFLNEVRTERVAEIERISEHVEISLTEVLNKLDQEIGRASNEVTEQVVGSQGRLAFAERRHDEANARRERRRLELQRQKALTLQGVERYDKCSCSPASRRRTIPKSSGFVPMKKPK